MYQSPRQQQIQSLITQGKLPETLVSLMRQGEYSFISDILKSYTAYINQINRFDEEPEKELDALQCAFDIFEKAISQLPEEQHTIFYALIFKGMNVDTSVYTYRSDDFKNEFQKSATNRISRAKHGRQIERAKARKLRHDNQYAALSNHPFVVKMRDTIRYPNREEALQTVKAVWDSGDKKGFLYVFDALQQTQNSQQYKRDPNGAEDSFIQQMATHPGLELVVLNVRRASSNGMMSADLPNLRILVSNKEKPLPFDIDESHDASAEKTGWSNGPSMEHDFWILTAKDQFTDLESYMRSSLHERTESIGYGAYNFSSNDDRTYGTAANVMAEIQRFLRVPRNFEAPAQDRLKEQVESIKMQAFAPIYMNRFLRVKEWSTWAAALSLHHANKKEREVMEGLIDYRTATRTLVTHGLFDAADHMGRHMSDNNLEQAKEISEGYVEGMQELHSDMIELSQPGEDISAGDALDRFERKRGFHPDVLHFPVSERKRLAYQDLSDIAVAHLTGHMMMEICTEQVEAEKEKKSISEAWDVKDETLKNVPLSGFMDTMINAGDITNFMRLLEHWDRFGQTVGGHKHKIKQAEILKRKIAKAGYSLTDERLVMKRFNNLSFRAVFDSDANIYIRTKHMVRFKSVEQIINDDNLPEALWAREVISVYDFTAQPEHQQRKEAQVQELEDFIEQKVIARDLKKQLAEIPEDAREFHIAYMRELLPSMLGIIAYEDNLSAGELEREVRVAAGAFDEATGTKGKPRFDRVREALSRVSTLFSNRP